MSDVVLPASIGQVRHLDPVLAEALAEDFARLSRAGHAVAWAQTQLPRLLATAGERSLLAAVVDLARHETGAPRAWAISWRGDLARGRASFEALAGDGAAPGAPPDFSRTVLGRVAAEGRPAWSDDAAQDARFMAAESVQGMALRSVGCVPLGSHGVLWLEDPDLPGRFDLLARMKIAALCALAGRVLEARAAPAAQSEAPVQPVAGLVGATPVMRELYGAIRAFAPMPWPALILGETGTGKEAIARALHALSPRADAPFVAVNCGAIVESLAESTLFGHERGAFTGADRRQEGLLDRVRGGTLFLDEVGELSPALQVKLLRLLQEGVYERVGGREQLGFQGRVVAATHRSLDDAGRRGAFREDLYFRLAAGVIRVPPLRDRRADVPALVTHLLGRMAGELGLKEPLQLDGPTLDELQGRAWPGNVRELENQLRGAVARALARGEQVLRVHDLGPASSLAPSEPAAPALAPAVHTPPPPPPTDPQAIAGIDPALDLKEATEAFQQARIRAALDAAHGNRSAAARSLGVSRQWLHRLLARWEEEG